MSRSIIQAKQQKKNLSAAQKKFNATIRKIEKQKELLAEWMTMRDEFEKTRAANYTPVLQQYNEKRVELVKRLDQFFERKSFSKLQRDKMAHFICETADELVPKGFTELKEIHDRYSDIDFDTLEEDSKSLAEDVLREMFEAEYGIDVGDDFDLSDPEKMAEKISEHIEAAEQEQANFRAEQKSNAAQKRQAAKQKKEDDNISQSIKSVYRQLTTALHPDRETDSDERDRKTELMKKVTTAYRNKDLLQLLELQLDVEQIDQDKIDGIAEDKLKYFNKILSRQLDEIETEVEDISMIFNHMAGMGFKVSPKQVMQRFKADTRELEKDVKAIERNLSSLTTVKNIQQWLKSYDIPDDDDDLFAGFF